MYVYDPPVDVSKCTNTYASKRTISRTTASTADTANFLRRRVVALRYCAVNAKKNKKVTNVKRQKFAKF